MKKRQKLWLVVAGLLVLVAGFVLSLTHPAIGTPVGNAILSTVGPRGAHMESVHLRFPNLLRAEVKQLTLPDRFEMQTGSVAYNPVWFLPGQTALRQLDAQNGWFIAPPSTGGGETGTQNGLREFAMRRVDRVNVRAFEITIPDPAGDRRFQLEYAKGSLIEGNLAARAQSGDTLVAFKGDRLASSDHWLEGTVTASGKNFADLARLAGLAAPDTPPYEVTLDVRIGPGQWRLEMPKSRVGDSDLSGAADVDVASDPPVIDARLRSETLDFDDLAVIFGLPLGIGGDETVSEEQRQARQAYARSSRLIPNVVIDFSRLDQIDGRVRYHAESVVDSRLDLASVTLDFSIDGRLVKATQADFTFKEGQATAYATLDGTRQPAVTDLKGHFEDIPLERLGLASVARGTLSGDAELTLTGNGFQAAAAQSSGKIAAWATKAEIKAMTAELAGLDLGESFILSLSEANAEDPVYTDIHCAVAVLELNEGMGTFAPAVINTEDSLILLDGQLDMGREHMDIRVRTDAKDTSWGSLIGNVDIEGPFRRPQIDALQGETVLQGAIAAILASVSGPLGALPFIEPGDAPDTPCGEILTRAQTATDGAD